jgi:hypothetical protein
VVAVESRGTRGRHRVTRRGAARPVSLTGASGRCEKHPLKGPTTIFIHEAINRSGGWL